MIQIGSLAIAIIGMLTVLRKEKHRVRVTCKSINSESKAYLSIINKSSFAIQINAIGYIDNTGVIHWLKTINDATVGKPLKLPNVAPARSSFEVSILNCHVKEFHTYQYGYIVQLCCGRTYFRNYNLSINKEVLLKIRCVISQISNGNLGFPKKFVSLH